MESTLLPTPQSRPLPSLPLEIKGHILSFCDPPTLFSTSLVSLAFLQLSSPILYQDVTIRGYKQLALLLLSLEVRMCTTLADLELQTRLICVISWWTIFEEGLRERMIRWEVEKRLEMIGEVTVVVGTEDEKMMVLEGLQGASVLPRTKVVVRAQPYLTQTFDDREGIRSDSERE